MNRMRIIIFTLIAVLTLGIGLSYADDVPQEPAAPAAVPADGGEKAVEGAGGCMPGGGCCGQGACAAAVGAEQKAADGTAPAAAAGGCPCGKMKKKM